MNLLGRILKFTAQVGVVTLLLVQVVFAQTSVPSMAFEERKALFDYDRRADFELRVTAVEERSGVTIKSVTFRGAAGGAPISAYLVEPPGEGQFAGVLWGHWLGHHTSNKSQYLDEAVDMAPSGVVSLLIDALWAEPGWYESRDPGSDYEVAIQQVVDFRRAMDLLLAQPTVDNARIGFVGHDYSGMYGAIAAGIEPRAKTHVFVAVTSSLIDWAFFAEHPTSKMDYIRQMSVFELTDFVREIDGSVLCQFSNTDPFISRADGNLFYNAITTEPKDRKRYDAEHFMGGDEIRADRQAWLASELGLEPTD